MTVLQQQYKFINCWFWVTALPPIKQISSYRNHYRQFCIISNYLLALFLFILQAYTATDIEKFIDAVTYVGHFTTVFSSWLIHQLSRHMLFNTVTTNDYVYRYEPIRKIQQQRTRKLGLNLRYFYCITLITYVVFVLSLTNGLIVRQFRNDNILTTSNKDHNKENYLFFLPTYHPWKINSELTYYATYFLQLIIAIFPSLFMLGVVFYILLFTIEVHFEYGTLFFALQTVNNKIIRKYHPRHQKSSLKHSYEYALIEQYYYTNEAALLIECINHHVTMIRSFGSFAATYTQIFIVYLIHSSFLFVSGIYLLLDSTYASQKMVQKCIEFFAIFPITVFLCILGEILENKNNKLRNMLYDIQWYNASIGFRKMIIFMLLNTKEETNLRISAKMKASLALLAVVIRASYSSLSIFINLKNY